MPAVPLVSKFGKTASLSIQRGLEGFYGGLEWINGRDELLGLGSPAVALSA